MDNTNQGLGTHGALHITKMSAGFRAIGISAAAATEGMKAMADAQRKAFPTVEQALDRAMAVDRAMESLREGEGPPDAIRVLASAKAKELGVQVSFMRALIGEAVEWKVVVQTKRGRVSARPSLTEKQQVELPREMLAVEAWKTAMREVGLL